MRPNVMLPARTRKTQTPYSYAESSSSLDRSSGELVIAGASLAHRLTRQRRTSTGNPPLPQTQGFYIPLEHFFAVASQFMPAFLQAASVFGVVPAKAGAATATIRLKAIIDTRAFIHLSSDAEPHIHAPIGGVETATRCHAKISRSVILPSCRTARAEAVVQIVFPNPPAAGV